MRKVGIAALAALSLGLLTQTASAEGFYVGAGLGSAETKVNGGFKDQDLGFKLFGGYSFNQYVGVEVEYLDGGSAKDEGAKVELDGFGLSVLGSIPVSDAFSLFARLGYGTWDAKVSAYGESDKDNDEELFYGLGAAFNLTEQFQVRAEWEGIDVSGGDFNYFGVAGVFKF
jgi:OOP family OmpA-OmpF porin